MKLVKNSTSLRPPSLQPQFFATLTVQSLLLSKQMLLIMHLEQCSIKFKAQKPSIQSLSSELHSKHKYSAFQRRLFSFRRQNERACLQAAVAEDLRETEDKAGKQGSWWHIQCALADSRKLIPIPKNLKLLHFPAAQTDFACHTDLFRLRTEESNMDIRTSGHLPVS